MRTTPADQAPPDVRAGAPGATLAEAQTFCARLTRGHYENFPVASRLLPRRMRPAVEAIYAFARTADDFADDPAHAGRRLERLDEWGGMLEDCFSGRAIHPVFIALGEAVRRHDLGPEPFRDLLEAFRLDVVKTRHPDHASLLDYCRLSANPIGRLVLRLFGHHDSDRIAWSDAICTALQLANHWQDVALDVAIDRVYLPQEDMRRHGVTVEDLRGARVTDGFRALLREQISRARERFEAGRPLCDAVPGRLRLELRLTWLGGQRILERIEAAGYDVFNRRPRLGPRDALLLAGRALRWVA